MNKKRQIYLSIIQIIKLLITFWMRFERGLDKLDLLLDLKIKGP